MVNLFEILINIFEELIITTFLMLYFGNKFNDCRGIIGYILIIFLSSGILTFFNSMFISEGMLGIVFIILYTLYALIFLKGDVHTKIFIAGFINGIVYSITLFSTLFLSIVTAQSGYPMYEMGVSRITLIAMSKILLIAACIILLRFRLNNIVYKKSGVALIVMPLVTLLSTTGIMEVFLKYYELRNELLLACFAVMMANITTYYVFIKINHDVEKNMKIKALEQKSEYERQHANEIEQLYSKICEIRHDLIHHFTMIQGLIGKDSKEAAEYINSVTNEQIIKIRQFVKTDNDYFDAIVNAKLALCENYKIKVRTRIMTGALDRLSNYEIASLFGNLFDNAIEASKNSEYKKIDLDVQIQKEHLSIFMRNTIDKSVLEKNKELNTTKENRELHGLGLKNIQRIVDSKNGVINYFEEDGYFCCDILC